LFKVASQTSPGDRRFVAQVYRGGQ
jgi:hypothetical protein